MNIFTSTKATVALGFVLVLSGAGVLGSTVAPVVTSQSVMQEAITAPDVDLKYDRVEVKTEASKVPVATDPNEWIAEVMRTHGVSSPVPVTAQYGCKGAGALGCTGVKRDASGAITQVLYVKISPSVIGTEQGVHVVLHEVGHANGIVPECEADAFAHNHGSNPAFRDFHC